MNKFKLFVNKISISSLIAFVASLLVLSIFFMKNFNLYFLISAVLISLLIAVIVHKITLNKKSGENTTTIGDESSDSISDECLKIQLEASRALSEMAKIYSNSSEVSMKSKINELMKITDKIAQDAMEDPNDVQKIKRFFNYYLPTTIKMLNMYDRMAYQDIEGKNINQTMSKISEVLDSTISSYRKMLDSLFNDQALDIETDIQVMNNLLAREGLTEKNNYFNINKE